MIGNDLGKVEFEKRWWILILNILDGGDLKVSFNSYFYNILLM